MVVNENLERLTSEEQSAIGIWKSKAVLRRKDLSTLSGFLSQTRAIAVTGLDLCCDISPFLPFFSYFFFFLAWNQHEDHWLSLLSLPESKDNDFFHVLSTVEWVCLVFLFCFSQGRKIQNQSNYKILTVLKSDQSCLSSANTSTDHFCDKDWKEYRK